MKIDIPWRFTTRGHVVFCALIVLAHAVGLAGVLIAERLAGWPPIVGFIAGAVWTPATILQVLAQDLRRKRRIRYYLVAGGIAMFAALFAKRR